MVARDLPNCFCGLLCAANGKWRMANGVVQKFAGELLLLSASTVR